LLTSGTFGPRGSTSSKSRDLESFLANRLRARTGLLGSTLFVLTWTRRTTPAGSLISALRASVRRSSGSVYTSLPTPTTPSGGQRSPEGTSATGRRPDGKKATVTLRHVARLMDTGEIAPGLTGATDGRSDLNPEWSRWLMSIPPQWLRCIAAVTLSSQSRQSSSSPRTCSTTGRARKTYLEDAVENLTAAIRGKL
jgi:hypothetical protein